MIRVTITCTDVGEWTGEHERPSAAYARALLQVYPERAQQPPEMHEHWQRAMKLWKDGSYARVAVTNPAKSVHLAIEKV